MKLRKTVNFEPFMSLFHGKFQPVNFACTALLKGPLTLEKLNIACLMLQKRHPLLRAKIAWDQRGNPYMAQDENYPIIPVEERLGSPGCCDKQSNSLKDHWNKIVEQEVGKIFDIDKGPFIRFILLREKDTSRSALILLCDHMSLDAEAAIVILKDLFNYIENSHLPIKSYEILPALPDLLNQETLDLTRHYYKTQYLKDFEKDKRKAKEEGITRDYSDPEPREFIFQMISWFMDKDFTASLLKHCKNHEVTVHTALGVSLLRAFYKVIGPEDQSERILQFPISARKFMKESIEDKLGCYITIEMIPLDCSWERNFWEICKELKESIQKVLNTGRIFSSAYFMRDYLVDDKSYFEQLKELPPRKHRGEYEFSLSNIGKQNFKSNYGDIKVRGLFAPTFSAVGEKVIGVNSCNGEMNFTLVFDDQTFTKEQGLKIKEWTILFLKQAMEFRN